MLLLKPPLPLLLLLAPATSGPACHTEALKLLLFALAMPCIPLGDAPVLYLCRCLQTHLMRVGHAGSSHRLTQRDWSNKGMLLHHDRPLL